MGLSPQETIEIIQRSKFILPRHIAILLDGNGRWAEQRGLSRPQGHRVGGETAKTFVRNCDALGIPYVTMFGFSTENWRRPMSEVKALLELLEEYLYSIADELAENNVRLSTAGRLDQMPSAIRKAMDFAKDRTAHCSGMVMNLAINYGSHAEMVDGVNLALTEIRAGRLAASELNREVFRHFLYTPELPFPDLLIRTSGEQRISNFLLWEAESAYYWITPTLWPDFDMDTLFEGIQEYNRWLQLN